MHFHREKKIIRMIERKKSYEPMKEEEEMGTILWFPFHQIVGENCSNMCKKKLKWFACILQPFALCQNPLL